MRRKSLLSILGLISSLLLLTYSPSHAAETPSISMATNKPQYTQGEIVKLVVTNNLDTPIWYINYPQPDLVFWEIEKAADDAWHRINFRLPTSRPNQEACRLAMYERPIGTPQQLKPNANLSYEWDQHICPLTIVSDSFTAKTINRGKYRFALHYSFDTIKLENIEAEPWKRPIDLGKTTIVYSNEFLLE